MKAILEFDLPEDDYQFIAASRASKWISAMWELDQWLRAQMKYHDDSYTEEQYEVLEKVREKLHDEMLDHSISFHE